MLTCYLAIQISNNINVASKLKKVCHIITKSSYVYMKFCTVQLSLSAKQAVVICSIVATLLWCSGMIVCHCLQKPSFKHILNAEISQYYQCLGHSLQTPTSGIAYLVKLEPPFKISAYRPEISSIITIS